MHFITRPRFSLISSLLFIGLLFSPIFNGNRSSDDSFRLLPPPFLSTAKAQGANFDGAGIAAYVKVSNTIDLKQVKSVMRHVETETEQFIIGAIGIPDYDETWDAKVYANTSGWIIVYYDRTQPTSNLVDWQHYSYGSEPITTLERALNTLADTQSITPPAPNFYHFNYPDATDIMIVLDVCTVGTDCPDLFEITLPDSFVYSETSWSLAGKGAINDYLKLFIDDNSTPYGSTIAVGSAWNIQRGKIFPILTAGFKHSFHLRSHYDFSGYSGAGAIVIVYNKGN